MQKQTYTMSALYDEVKAEQERTASEAKDSRQQLRVAIEKQTLATQMN
jgi:hypothetical protein